MARKIDPAKRSAILKSARVILLRDGYAAAKMSDIAVEAGVAPGTLYLYFDSKEALANAIGEDFFTRLSAAFAEVLSNLDSPRNVKVLVDWAVRIGTEEKDLFRLFKQQAPDEKSKEGPRLEFRNQMSAAMERLMQIEGTRKYPPVDLAEVIMGVLHSVIMSCAMPCLSINSDELQATAVKVLQHALFEDSALTKID
jgi:AcrR family transcriptional regulator